MQKWAWGVGLLCLFVFLGILFFPTGQSTDSDVDGVKVTVHSGEVQVNGAEGFRSLKGGQELTVTGDGRLNTKGSEETSTSEDNLLAAPETQPATDEIEYATRQDYWLTGYSMDDKGQPLQGTKIKAIEHIRGRGTKALEPIETDERGYFAVELHDKGYYSIEAEPKLDTLSIESANAVLSATKTAEVCYFNHKAAGISLKGKVLEKETQKPIEGAEIKLGIDFSSQDWEKSRERRAPVAVSEKDGTFVIKRIQPGSYTVQTRAKGYRLFRQESWDQPGPLASLKLSENSVHEDILIELEPGGSVLVRVKDKKGQPVPLAIVEVVMPIRNFSHDNSGNADEKGEWRSDSLPIGKGVVQVRGNKRTNTGLTVSEPFTTGTADNPAIVNITMQEAAKVSGRVSFKDGQPATDHIVWAMSHLAGERIGDRGQSSMESSDTDISGNYSCNELGEGKYSLIACKKSPDGSYRDIVRMPNKVEITLKAGEIRSGVDIVVNNTGEGETVRGHVVDQDGKPVVGVLAQAHIYDPAIPDSTPGKHATANTDENGNFEITGLAKTAQFHFAIWADEYQKYSKELPMDGKLIEVTLIAGGDISGTVVDSQTKQPVSGADLTLYSLTDLNFREKVTRTMADGRFEFARQAPGQFRIVALEKNHSQKEVSDIVVTAGKPTTDLVIQMDQGLKFIGQTITPEGQPVSGVAAALFSHRPTGMRTFSMPELVPPFEPQTASDASGVFEVLIDPQKPDRLILRPRDFAPKLMTVSAQQVSPQPVPIVMTPGARIEGKVFDSEGEPQSNARLFIFDAPEMNFIFETQTDDNGEYRLEHLPAMVLVVMKTGSGRSEARDVKQAAFKEGETTVINFGDESGSTIEGVVTQYGQPLAGAVVYLQSAQQYQVQLAANSGPDGHYQIKSVPEGEYQILASLPSNENSSMAYFADAMQNLQINAQQKEYTVNFDISKAEVEGVVLDKTTGQPVAGVEIRPDFQVVRSEADQYLYSRSVVTNAQGVFKTSLKRPAVFHMEALKAGYDIEKFDIVYNPPSDGVSPRLSVEVKLTPSETLLEAHLFYNGRPVVGPKVHFSGTHEYPNESIPEQPGVYRVSGMPEGRSLLSVTAIDGNGGDDLREKTEINIQKGVTNQLLMNLTAFISYALDFRNPDGKSVTFTEKEIQVELPGYPQSQPTQFGGLSTGDSSYIMVAIPAGPTRMILRVKGTVLFDGIPINLSTPKTNSLRMLELRVAK